MHSKMSKGSFEFYYQSKQLDCGPSCLRMILYFHECRIEQDALSNLCNIDGRGVTLLGISDAAKKLGFYSIGLKLHIKELQDIHLPCILFWKKRHYVVLYKIANQRFELADPAFGLLSLHITDFMEGWQEDMSNQKGIALLIYPEIQGQFYHEQIG
jgi:ATP-binding cassette subfamily B protein